MIPFEALTFIGLSVLLGAGAVTLFLILRQGGSSRSAAHLDAGRFRSALSAAEAGGSVDRDEILTAAVAAKHLLDLASAATFLRRLVADDPRDGEAWLELGLVAGYEGRHDDAEEAFDRVAESRSDLLESLTLHRAWLAAERGDFERAERLLSDVEIPLETKLRTDLGTGDPTFAEWFLQAGLLWRRRGDLERAEWALSAARHAAPESLLIAERCR